MTDGNVADPLHSGILPVRIRLESVYSLRIDAQHKDQTPTQDDPWLIVKCKQKFELHKALQFLGDVFHAQGDQDTAISLFTVALDGFTCMDVHRSRAECMVRLGDISKLNGDELKAVELWQTARPLFERSSQGKQFAHLDEKLADLNDNQSQEVQQETVDHLSEPPAPPAPTEHLEQLSGTESTNSTGIEVIENMGLEEKKALVLVDT
ncbi:hypothetical protein B0H13DRAFT_1887048 [Mycena leptocephala]|nr:hypothetical protein B0H13DRAFT_1887048 [Mycena leptocephala]